MFNCIGHNNHRYFMVFIIYMWIGTCYIIHCGWTRIFVLLDIRAVKQTELGDCTLIVSMLILQTFILNLVDTLGMVG